MTAGSRAISDSNRRSSPWPFFALAVGWSWLFWIPLALSGQNVRTFPGLLFLAGGGIGPALSAIILLYTTKQPESRQDYWRRVFDFQRIPLKWYAVIFLTAPFYSSMALLTGILLGKRFPSVETAVGYLSHPLSILPFAAITLVYGPLPEELGWRGYALDRLQAKWTALSSNILLGMVWSLWHMPMFFMKGSFQSAVFPLGSARFWLAMGPGILAEALVLGWIYNNTRRSTLAAILFHFMMNFTGEFLRLPGDFKNYQFLWLMIIAIVVVVIWGPATLTGRPPGKYHAGQS